MNASCSVTDCDTAPYARGFCQHHYSKWWRTGDPLYVRVLAPVADRIFDRVEPTGFCWEWTGYRLAGGYGMFFPGRGAKSILAHRFVYEHLVGPIPDGQHIDHLCRNRGCVNPDHLEPVTRRENLLRGFGWAGINARKTVCVNGHPFDDQNTRVERLGRRCRKCHATSEARRRASRRLTRSLSSPMSGPSSADVGDSSSPPEAA